MGEEVEIALGLSVCKKGSSKANAPLFSAGRATKMRRPGKGLSSHRSTAHDCTVNDTTKNEGLRKERSRQKTEEAGQDHRGLRRR
mgnify:CR=1 FL=1